MAARRMRPDLLLCVAAVFSFEAHHAFHKTNGALESTYLLAAIDCFRDDVSNLGFGSVVSDPVAIASINRISRRAIIILNKSDSLCAKIECHLDFAYGPPKGMKGKPPFKYKHKAKNRK